MKRLFAPFACSVFAVVLAAMLLPGTGRATVYQPGLWFVHDDTHETISPSTYPSIAAMSGAVPSQGVFMEYTATVATNKEPWTTSFGQSGTNAYDGAVYTWHLNEGFGYEGSIFVESGKTYTIAKWHGRYMRVKVDGTELFSDYGWFNTPNRTYTAAATGWIPFELRAGINGETGVGPLNRSFGTGFNTEGVTLKNRSDTSWALPPWQKFLDPGDCSLLRIVKSETDYMTLDSVAMDGDDLVVTASFVGVPVAGALTAFYGLSDGGDLPSAWSGSAALGTVAAGDAASGVYRVPGAAAANFVALRLQNTDYAAGPYTQFTAASSVPKPVPTFDLVCTDVGYTNLTFTATIASVGIGATSVTSAVVQIATDASFANVVKEIPLVGTTAGSETAYTSGLVSNTVYYARVRGANNLGASNDSGTVGPLTTLTPTAATAEIAFDTALLGGFATDVTVTDWGDDSVGATVRLEACASSTFMTLAAVSEEVEASLGTATNLVVVGLLEDAEYYLRARVVNSWGITTYVPAGTWKTRGLPFVGTPIVWETASDGSLSVHERLLAAETLCTAELFLGGASQGVREISSPGRFSWTGLAQPSAGTTVRVDVYAEVGNRPYRAQWSATIVPGSASYLEDKWVYDSAAKTLTWVDSYPFTNVVKNVTASGTELSIGRNLGDSPAALNLDFSPGVADGWTIVRINGESSFNKDSVITNLVCPPTLREIGRAAFEGNMSLRHVTFNEGLVNLGTTSGSNNCFKGCKALESISGIPSTVTQIGDSVFNGCTSLTNDIVWPRSLPVVPNSAFSSTAIRSFKAEYGVTHLGSYGTEGRTLSWNNAIKTVDFPVTLLYVSGRMFSDTDLKSGFTANVWYRGFPKLGWHSKQWDNTTWGTTTVTNWFEWHHRDEFSAFAETNQQFTIRLPETFKGEGTWAASGCNQIIRWWRDPDQMPPTVLLVR